MKAPTWKKKQKNIEKHCHAFLYWKNEIACLPTSNNHFLPILNHILKLCIYVITTKKMSKKILFYGQLVKYLCLWGSLLCLCSCPLGFRMLRPFILKMWLWNSVFCISWKRMENGKSVALPLDFVDFSWQLQLEYVILQLQKYSAYDTGLHLS